MAEKTPTKSTHFVANMEPHPPFPFLLSCPLVVFPPLSYPLRNPSLPFFPLLSVASSVRSIPQVTSSLLPFPFSFLSSPLLFSLPDFSPFFSSTHLAKMEGGSIRGIIFNHYPRDSACNVGRVISFVRQIRTPQVDNTKLAALLLSE